jgi:hypothetical protein
MKAEDQPTLSFPNGFDDCIAAETEDKGVLYRAVVSLPGGKRVQVGFYDPVTLAQAVKSGRSFVALPGMIVVPRVTVEWMTKAVEELFLTGYFESLAPLPDGRDFRP